MSGAGQLRTERKYQCQGLGQGRRLSPTETTNQESSHSNSDLTLQRSRYYEVRSAAPENMSEADGSQQVFEENVSGADDSNGTGQCLLSSSSSSWCCDS